MALNTDSENFLSPEELEAYNQEITKQNIHKIVMIAKSIVQDIKSNYVGTV